MFFSGKKVSPLVQSSSLIQWIETPADIDIIYMIIY